MTIYRVRGDRGVAADGTVVTDRRRPVYDTPNKRDALRTAARWRRLGMTDVSAFVRRTKRPISW